MCSSVPTQAFYLVSSLLVLVYAWKSKCIIQGWRTRSAEDRGDWVSGALPSPAAGCVREGFHRAGANCVFHRADRDGRISACFFTPQPGRCFPPTPPVPYSAPESPSSTSCHPGCSPSLSICSTSSPFCSTRRTPWKPFNPRGPRTRATAAAPTAPGWLHH